jgi:dolichol kinase
MRERDVVYVTTLSTAKINVVIWKTVRRKLFSKVLTFSWNYTAFEVRLFMWKHFESVLIDMNEAFTENITHEQRVGGGVGGGGGVGVTITVIALLNNFNIPCPSARSAIMIVKVQLECQLNIRLSMLLKSVLFRTECLDFTSRCQF